MNNTPEWLEKAIELYNEDLSFMKIGKLLNIDRKKVAKVLLNNGYKAKYSFETTGGVVRESKTWRKYSFNENYFERIDTEWKAYWLGFIYADGYVNSQKSSFELGLQDLDYSHIVKFRNAISGDMPVREKNKNWNGKIYKGYSLQVNSIKFKQDLINKGCLENKSLIIEFPTYSMVPKSLMRHFIRGYVDGDGCYTLYHSKYVGKKKTTESSGISFEVVGTEHFLRGMIHELELHTNTIHQLRNVSDERCKRVMYGGPYALDIIDKLYKDATIYLDRKYDKVLNLLAVVSGNTH